MVWYCKKAKQASAAQVNVKSYILSLNKLECIVLVYGVMDSIVLVCDEVEATYIVNIYESSEAKTPKDIKRPKKTSYTLPFKNRSSSQKLKVQAKI